MTPLQQVYLSRFPEAVVNWLRTIFLLEAIQFEHPSFPSKFYFFCAKCMPPEFWARIDQRLPTILSRRTLICALVDTEYVLPYDCVQHPPEPESEPDSDFSAAERTTDCEE